MVAVVSEYCVCSRLKCPLCPFQIHSVVQAVLLPSPPCWPLRPIRRPPIKAEAVPASHTRHRPVSLPLKPSLFLNVQNGSPATSPLNVLWLSARVIRASPAPTLPSRCFGRGSSGSCSAGRLLPCRPPLTLPCRGALPAPRRSPAAAVPGAPFSASLPA